MRKTFCKGLIGGVITIIAGCKTAGTASVSPGNHSVLLAADSSLFRPNPFIIDSAHVFGFYYSDPLNLHDDWLRLSRDAPTAVGTIPEGELSSDGVFYPVHAGEKIVASLDDGGNIHLTVPNNDQRTREFSFLLNYHNLSRNLNYKIFAPYLANGVINEGNSQRKILPELLPLYMVATRKIFDSMATADHISPAFKTKTASSIPVDSVATILRFDRLYFGSLTNEPEKKKVLVNDIDMMNKVVNADNLLYYHLYIQDLFDLLMHMEHIRTIVRKTTELPPFYDVIKKYFSGTGRNYLLTYTFITQMIAKRIAIPDDYLTDYRQTCDDARFVAAVDRDLRASEKVASRNGFATADGLLQLDKNKTTTIGAVFKSRKNKILLVDFWASWCSPCREEMPQKRELAENYKGKPIEFINISLDRVIKNWKVASSEEKMQPNNSFLLIKPELSTFVNSFSIHTIPRYLIIGKDGAILYKEAPGPGDPKLKNILDRLLAE